MPSFDAVSELNAHEVANAVDQANRELGQRFDFKDTGARFELKEFTVTLHAQVDFQLRQMLEIVKLRGMPSDRLRPLTSISLTSEPGNAEPISFLIDSAVCSPISMP